VFVHVGMRLKKYAVSRRRDMCVSSKIESLRCASGEQEQIPKYRHADNVYYQKLVGDPEIRPYILVGFRIKKPECLDPIVDRRLTDLFRMTSIRDMSLIDYSQIFDSLFDAYTSEPTRLGRAYICSFAVRRYTSGNSRLRRWFHWKSDAKFSFATGW